MAWIHSIRWRLVASYVVLTLLAVSLVGLLALALIQAYIGQQERAYLTANGRSIAEQAWGLMTPVPRLPELSLLAQSAAFLGDAQVRILDARHEPLIDSGPRQGVDQMVWLAPPSSGAAGAGDPLAAVVFVGGAGQEPAWPSDVWLDGQLPPGTQMATVVRSVGPWGSRFTFEDSSLQAAAEPPDELPAELPGQLPGEQPNGLPAELPGQLPGEPGASPAAPSEAGQTARSAEVVTVPIGDGAQPVGYVELSQGPDLSGGMLQTARQALMLAALVATLVAGAVGLVVSGGLTAPLGNLSAAAGRMRQGDLSARAAVGGRGEIAALADQFNRMADELERSFATLAAERDALRQFIADASHELRTPITALRNFVALLPDAAVEDVAAHREFLSESSAQIERLEWITRNLLDLSRLDAGLVALQPGRHAAGELLAAAAAPFSAVAAEKGIRLVIAPVPPDLAVTADRARLEMALSNLVDNAIKFSPPGGQVVLEATSRPGAGVLLSVRDDGPGIPPEDLPHVFERFYRGRQTGVPGSGLGLAIVHSIVQLHGGQVRVESAPGTGSRFSIELPGPPGESLTRL